MTGKNSDDLAILFRARDWYDPKQYQAAPYHNIGHVAPTFSDFLQKMVFED